MVTVLKGSIRTGSGKGPNKKLRAQGYIPGVLYGAGEPPVTISFPINELHQTIKKLEQSPLIHVEFGDNETDAVLKEIQYDPLSDEVLHIDLQRVAVGQELTVTIRLQLAGVAEGVKQGGIVQFVTRKVDVKCLPKNLPETIEVDISGLTIGDSLEVKDLVIPEGVEILESPNQPVVVIASPTVIAAEEPKEEAEEGEEEAAKEGKEAKQEAGTAESRKQDSKGSGKE